MMTDAGWNLALLSAACHLVFILLKFTVLHVDGGADRQSDVSCGSREFWRPMKALRLGSELG